MTVTSIILMILCLGGIWGALIYYLIRMILITAVIKQILTA